MFLLDLLVFNHHYCLKTGQERLKCFLSCLGRESMLRKKWLKVQLFQLHHQSFDQTDKLSFDLMFMKLRFLQDLTKVYMISRRVPVSLSKYHKECIFYTRNLCFTLLVCSTSVSEATNKLKTRWVSLSCVPNFNEMITLLVGQESSSTASKTSDEKFRLKRKLLSKASKLSSKWTPSGLMMPLSVVGLMTMMRGTVWGDLGSVFGAFSKFSESKELLLWLFTLSLILLFLSCSSEMSLVRLSLRLRVITSSGRLPIVMELETNSWSWLFTGSFMADGCW